MPAMPSGIKTNSSGTTGGKFGVPEAVPNRHGQRQCEYRHKRQLEARLQQGRRLQDQDNQARRADGRRAIGFALKQNRPKVKRGHQHRPHHRRASAADQGVQ